MGPERCGLEVVTSIALNSSVAEAARTAPKKSSRSCHAVAPLLAFVEHTDCHTTASASHALPHSRDAMAPRRRGVAAGAACRPDA